MQDVEATSSPSPDRQVEVVDDEAIDHDGDLGLMMSSLFCLFEDLNHMRKLISPSVQEHVDGKIDLMNMRWLRTQRSILLGN